jgi:hypothetical protein
MNKASIVVHLTNAEALVLLDWLARTDESRPSMIEDPAEDVVLTRIQGQLESALVEPFAMNYKELLVRARKEVSDST